MVSRSSLVDAMFIRNVTLIQALILRKIYNKIQIAKLDDNSRKKFTEKKTTACYDYQTGQEDCLNDLLQINFVEQGISIKVYHKFTWFARMSKRMHDPGTRNKR